MVSFRTRCARTRFVRAAPPVWRDFSRRSRTPPRSSHLCMLRNGLNASFRVFRTSHKKGLVDAQIESIGTCVSLGACRVSPASRAWNFQQVLLHSYSCCTNGASAAVLAGKLRCLSNRRATLFYCCSHDAPPHPQVQGLSTCRTSCFRAFAAAACMITAAFSPLLACFLPLSDFCVCFSCPRSLTRAGATCLLSTLASLHRKPKCAR